MSRNQLDQETSPYLLLHKDNPVHWYPWGPEALAEAERSGKPILLSIGYTACHWCHVMNRESFSDADTAALMNDLFVNVKVDREERPDLDQLYQAASNTMGSQGGWPLTMFLSPKAVPFAAGTYFPNEARFGQKPFKTILEEVSRAWREQPEPVAATGLRVTDQLTALWNRDMRGQVDAQFLDAGAMRVAQRFDVFFGGISGQVKFPTMQLVEMLWRAYLRSGAQQFHQLVIITMDNIVMGGLYDHVGGGFARYSTDQRWLVPHFEKMVSDNAQIIEMMTALWQHNRNGICRERVEETIGWLLREMRVGDGFASSLDADSDGEEGKYYVWSEAEIDAVLKGTFVQRFKEAYSVTREGNFNGNNILHRINSKASYPLPEADEALLARQRGLLLAARQQRNAPIRDDKLLADANGMVITALANAGAAFQRPEWINAAVVAFDFVVKSLGEGDTLCHTWRAGKRGHMGFADDYAHMARAALTLWEVTGEKRYLDRAIAWAQILTDKFWDQGSGGYFFSSSEDDPLIVRTRMVFDQSQPCANGTMISVLAKLFKATSDPAYQTRANTIVHVFAAEAARAYISMGSYFNGLEYLVAGLQIVVVGLPGHPKTHEFAAAVMGRSLPNRFLVVVAPDAVLPEGHPAFGKTMVNGQPTAYVCQRQTCSAPVINPVALSQMLQLPTRPPAGTRPQ